jgi:hypothetical protein
VENLVKSDRGIRGGRFVTAFEHAVGQVIKGELLFFLAEDLDCPIFDHAVILGTFLDGDTFLLRCRVFVETCATTAFLNRDSNTFE